MKADHPLPAIRREGDSVFLNLWVKPNAHRDAWGEHQVGPHGPALRVSVACAPEKGKATQQVLRFVAKEFGVTLQQVALLSGASTPYKRVRIDQPRRWPEVASRSLSPPQNE